MEMILCKDCFVMIAGSEPLGEGHGRSTCEECGETCDPCFEYDNGLDED